MPMLRFAMAQCCVDVVEIDPVIYSLGKRLHPDHPYDSPKVHVILTTHRSYLRQLQGTIRCHRFRLGRFAHNNFGYSNMRIDNYVYTEDSFREAKNLLKPTGVLSAEVRGASALDLDGRTFLRHPRPGCSAESPLPSMRNQVVADRFLQLFSSNPMTPNSGLGLRTARSSFIR